jgi:hypothetical protein
MSTTLQELEDETANVHELIDVLDNDHVALKYLA